MISLPKIYKFSFDHELCLCCPIIFNICTEHGSDTAMLCAQFQNDYANVLDVMAE